MLNIVYVGPYPRSVMLHRCSVRYYVITLSICDIKKVRMAVTSHTLTSLCPVRTNVPGAIVNMDSDESISEMRRIDRQTVLSVLLDYCHFYMAVPDMP